MRQAAGERIQNAAVAQAALVAQLRRAAVAEHALEDYLRVQLHRQRIGGRGPGDGVGIGAAIAFAAVAGIGAGIFHRALHRRHQVLLTDLLRDDLVDGCARANVGAGGLLGLLRAHEGRGHPVIRAGGAGRRLRRAGVQTAHDHRLLDERLQRLPIEGKYGAQARPPFPEPNSREPRHAARSSRQTGAWAWPRFAPAPSRPESWRPVAAAPASPWRCAERSGVTCAFS